jgi:hypothetical protein
MVLILNGDKMLSEKRNIITGNARKLLSSLKVIVTINIIFIASNIIYNASGAAAAGTTIDTVAGELTCIKDEIIMECITSLNKKTILHFDCEFALEPKVIGDFRGYLGTMDEVIVLQERLLGSACNGGPLHIIGLRKNKSYLVTGPLDFCGGKAPIIEHNNNSIFITFPSSPQNRGPGIILTEKWFYRNGELKKE